MHYLYQLIDYSAIKEGNNLVILAEFFILQPQRFASG